MRFLADESCDFLAVRALRALGHDVVAVSQIVPGAADDEVMALADRENRILLTEDKDFGQIYYASENAINRLGDNVGGCFIVLQPGQIRISRRPEG